METSDISDGEYTESQETERETDGLRVNDGSRNITESLSNTVEKLKGDIAGLKFCIENIAAKDLSFYTGFPSYESLMACYNYLGPGVDDLMYWGSKDKDVGHGQS